jgi:hypothetical protein
MGLTEKRVHRILILVAISGFLIGLSAYGYMGSFMRIIGDDYCYGGVLSEHGFWKAQTKAYFNRMPFHGNRFMLTFVSTFISLFPPVINGIMPTLTILIFVGSGFTLLSGISKKWCLNLSFMGRILISLALAFFTFWLAPTVKQSLYFRSAMLPSTMPILLSLFLVAFLIRKPIRGWTEVFLAFVFALLNAGFSENGAAIQGILVFLVFIGAIWAKLRKALENDMLLFKSVSAILGTVAGIIILWISPSISRVRGEMDLMVFQAVRLSLRHTFDFYLGTFRTVYLGVAAIIIFGFLVFFLFLVNQSFADRIRKSSFQTFMIVFLAAHISTLAIIFALMIPSAFTRNVYPDPRHMIAGMLAMVLVLLISGFCLAGMVYLLIHKIDLFNRLRLILVASVLTVIFSFLYPIRYVPQITAQASLFRYWAAHWDQRHEVIVEAVEDGKQAVHVMTLDHIVEDVGELCPQPEKCWYNACAAQFYGIQIFADQPGWEEGLQNR